MGVVERTKGNNIFSHDIEEEEEGGT